MISRLHIGKSEHEDVARAVAEAARAALADCPSPALAVVLATQGYDAETLAARLSGEVGNLPWVGCSSAAVFAGPTLLRRGMVVGVVCAPEAFVGVGAAGPVSGNPRSAGAAAGARALDQMPAPIPSRRRAVVLLLNALSGQGAEVVRGAAQEGGNAASYTGGGASDDLRFTRTFQLARGRAFTDHAVAVVMDLPGRFGVGVRHGWRPYGPPTMVTRARGAYALELEYEEAFEVYRRTAAGKGDEVTRENFGPFARLHPLGIPQADGDHLIRDPIGVEADGSLRCVAEVPDGSLVRVMEAQPGDLAAAAGQAAELARAGVDGPLGGALVFDCVSRYMVLGDGIAEELSAMHRGLGESVPWIGCLTTGEVGALGAGVPQFHNKTTSVLAIPG